jgi:Glycosyl hydrolase family 63 C-terminal domain
VPGGEPPAASSTDAERQRVREANGDRPEWYRWGPYLADREWGTVREDYSPDGQAWSSFTHDQARSRAYRWGEDGLLGISDDTGRLCFALGLWNEADPILKERLFGLSGPEGNHGEDVKEAYYFCDATPTASYLRAVYLYPQRAFPYDELLRENRRRGREATELELLDTGIFDEDRYFEVEVVYAKAAPDDIVIRITATNRGADTAPLHLLPTLWFRNTWSWGRDDRRPSISVHGHALQARHHRLGTYWLSGDGEPDVLLTDNDTNTARLWGDDEGPPYAKDAFHDAIVGGHPDALAPLDHPATKAALHYRFDVGPGQSQVIDARLRKGEQGLPPAGADAVIGLRKHEADAFYAGVAAPTLGEDARLVQRQAFAGLIWCKQLYHYDVAQWLEGDPTQPMPPAERLHGRNADWGELNTFDVLSMPDTWEYPWFAAWDLAFHTIPLALIDPGFAKQQLLLMTREWYMHPNGQLPAYEWNFSDVNPPVHAWATWRVYKIDRRVSGRADRAFLERVFHKLLLNFTWWVNRKDREGRNVFQGGFLGLDNVGVFDRSAPLPAGGHLAQADGTAWMGLYCVEMLVIALELARENPVYEDVATKFFEHFLYVADALNNLGGEGIPMWHEDDGFFYDVLHLPDDEKIPLRLRSMVGLIPLLAVETLEPDLLDQMPMFRSRLRWFLRNRPELARLVASWEDQGMGRRRLLALVHGDRMRRLLSRMLDPNEFLSDHGVRSLSRAYLEHPYMLSVDGAEYRVGYESAESMSGLFGGNSNWRGPVWFPINYLIVEALQKFHHFYGDELRIECPVGSGTMLTLGEVATELSRRLESIFLLDENGRRAVFGSSEQIQSDPEWRDRILFYEYFCGDTGRGLGASHQTGWTALVAKLLDRTARRASG